MKKLFYFSEAVNEEICFTKERLIEEMKELGMEEIQVSKAVRELKTDYFHCKAVGEIGEKGEGCGKECGTYQPRNGKSGCCKHRGFCYEPSDQKYILKINGKLTKGTR